MINTPSDDRSEPANPAVDLIRQKLQQVYANEPNAATEIQLTQSGTHASRHQQFMYRLSQSGRSLADIQTAWHNYYVGLPDHEKHEVWQEFYQEYNRRSSRGTMSPQPSQHMIAPPQTPSNTSYHSTESKDPRSVADIKQQLLNTISRRSTKRGGHIKSILFGLSFGTIVVAILMFGLFNERFIAPFITPSKSVSSTPIIIDPGNMRVGMEPKIIIPKINLEIPVVYTEPSIEEDAVQNALQQGALHYATTSNPGEKGNGVLFGHSSNNILNSGKYKFAFVLLNRLEPGDTFSLHKDGKRYVYRVFDKKIIKPDNVSVLGDTLGKTATFSLITCDPPGTSLNRLVVTGEQITPDPATNLASTAKPNQPQPQNLPSNAETLWHRLYTWLTS